jgi:hypothetical protein
MEENPPLSVVQRFVHLLDARDVDYSEEIGIYYNKIIFIIFFFFVTFERRKPLKLFLFLVM